MSDPKVDPKVEDPKVVAAAAEMAKNLRLSGDVDELLAKESIQAYLADASARRASSPDPDNRSSDLPEEMLLAETEGKNILPPMEKESETPMEVLVGPKKMESTGSRVHVNADPKFSQKDEYHPADGSEMSGDSSVGKIDKINNEELVEPIMNNAQGMQLAMDELASTSNLSMFNYTAQMEKSASDQEIPSDSDVGDGGGDQGVLPFHEMYFHLTWLRPDGRKFLAQVSDYMSVKDVAPDSKRRFELNYFIKNITYLPITFKVESCDQTKYKINRPIGILNEGEKVVITMSTEAGQWSYTDLEHDSVRILVSAFTASQDFELKNSNRQKFKAMVKFWKKHATQEFPYAELHYIKYMIPFDQSYLDDDGLNKTAFQRFHKTFYLLSTIGSNMIKFERKIEDTDLDMMFGALSPDFGDLFVRDQMRALISNRDRMHKFALGQKYYLKNLVYLTATCVSILTATWALKSGVFAAALEGFLNLF